MTIPRRTFLGITGGVVAGAAAAAVAGPLVWDDLVHHPRPSSQAAPPAGRVAPNERVLVVVNLGGGNDGLNTLVPAGAGAYHDARPTLGVADSSLVALTGTTAYGLNPSLAPLQKWWESKHLLAVDGMAIPGQTRSHFQASDVWWSGDPADPRGTGWLGRWLDHAADGAEHNPLRAISVGLDNGVLVGRTAVATNLGDPQGFTLATPKMYDVDQVERAFRATASPRSNDALDAASQQAVSDALGSVRTLAQVVSGPAEVQFSAADSTNVIPGGPPTASVLPGRPAGGTGQAVTVTSMLEVAAGIIDLEIGTRVIVVSAGGFDTHADQAAAHPALLTDLAQGLDGFLTAMAAKGRGDDVLVMTTSEFGRRVQENGSGTDHGEASVHFLAGGRVNGGQVVGEANLAKLDDGDVPIEIDTRSMYAVALDWLGGPTDEILKHRYDRYTLIRS
jgi:uncharacterized protein (DUF1501 family)